MDSKDIKTLLILEAIDTEEYQSQRELSRKLNISLGLVNTFVNSLKKQGIFKTSKLPNNRVRYNLSTKGLDTKAILTKRYVSHLLCHYSQIKSMIYSVIMKIQHDGRKIIALYGAGELSEIACILLGDENLNNIKLFDEKKAGGKICGLEINDDVLLGETSFDAIVIMDFDNISATRQNLIGMGVPPEKIFSILK